jgi:hypothetical protein
MQARLNGVSLHTELCATLLASSSHLQRLGISAADGKIVPYKVMTRISMAAALKCLIVSIHGHLNVRTLAQAVGSVLPKLKVGTFLQATAGTDRPSPVALLSSVHM